VSDPERMLWISVFDQVSVFSKGNTGKMESWVLENDKQGNSPDFKG
jgi:hypothetical protein